MQGQHFLIYDPNKTIDLSGNEIRFPCGPRDHAIYLIFARRRDHMLLRVDNLETGIDYAHFVTGKELLSEKFDEKIVSNLMGIFLIMFLFYPLSVRPKNLFYSCEKICKFSVLFMENSQFDKAKINLEWRLDLLELSLMKSEDNKLKFHKILADIYYHQEEELKAYNHYQKL